MITLRIIGLTLAAACIVLALTTGNWLAAFGWLSALGYGAALTIAGAAS